MPKVTKDQNWKLPPLILHPFADLGGPGKLIESSKANLMLQGMLPRDQHTVEELEATLLGGRYCEIKMLYYVGKDLLRWIEQSLEFAERDPELSKLGIVFQSLAAFLVDDPPPAVRAKLQNWGVVDYKAIFSRAIGLNIVFADAPSRDLLSPYFIKNYYRFADHMYLCHQNQQSFPAVSALRFDFDLFASGEYSRILEREWQES